MCFWLLFFVRTFLVWNVWIRCNGSGWQKLQFGCFDTCCVFVWLLRIDAPVTESTSTDNNKLHSGFQCSSTIIKIAITFSWSLNQFDTGINWLISNLLKTLNERYIVCSPNRKFHSSHVPSAIIRINLIFRRYPLIDTCNDNHHDYNNNNRHMVFFRTRFSTNGFLSSVELCLQSNYEAPRCANECPAQKPLIGKHRKFTILDLLARRSSQSHGDGHCRIKWIDLHMEHFLIEFPSMSILSHAKQNQSHLTH